MLYRRLGREKHVREDGSLVELVSSIYQDEPFDRIHSYVVTIKPGRTRAGHFHRKKEEWLCLASGRVELTLEDVDGGMRETISLDSGSEDYSIIHIPVNVAHILENTSSTETAALVVFSKEPEDKGDTIKHDFGKTE